MKKMDLVKCYDHILLCIFLHSMLIRNESDCEYFSEEIKDQVQYSVLFSSDGVSFTSSKKVESIQPYIKSLCLEHLGLVE